MDFEGEVAVIVDEMPMGTPKERIAPHIKLLMLVNDVSLRALAATGNEDRLRLGPGQAIHQFFTRGRDAG